MVLNLSANILFDRGFDYFLDDLSYQRLHCYRIWKTIDAR